MKTLHPVEYTKQYGDPTGPDCPSCELREAEAADYRLPRRHPRSHKYHYGRALLIAGSRGYSGAPVLAANACERSGAGLTWLMVPESIYPIASARCDGAVVTPLPATAEGGLSEKAWPAILAALRRADACLIGPGLGTGTEARELVKAVLREAECPLVLDADALNACAKEPELLTACRAPLLLTPHEGEFKRLGGDLSQGRLAGALRFCSSHPTLHLILKGYGTLLCCGEDARVNPTGGSGDVLGGILGALLAQGFALDFAAGCAVWLHGRAGDLAAAELGEYSVTPSDLIAYLPRAFQMLAAE